MVRIEILMQEAHMIIYKVNYDCFRTRKSKIRIIKNISLSCFGEVFSDRNSFEQIMDHHCIMKKEIPMPMEGYRYICGGCKKEFESYYDGIGFNTGFCPKCLDRHETIGLIGDDY